MSSARPDEASAKPARRPFLTAEWRYLLMANYEVDPAILAPRIPKGTELDLWQGAALVSMVGFRFVRTRLRGVPVPFHRDFDEVNLRFYLRRRVKGEWRRGVAFVKELVPRAAIAWVARKVYEEPYSTLPMRHRVAIDAHPATVEYAWKYRGRWCALSAQLRGEPEEIRPGSEEEFITEHYWGWTALRDGNTAEYQVTHPRWRAWSVDETRFECDVARLYGPEFAEALSKPPRSAFVADGSAIAIDPGTRIRSE